MTLEFQADAVETEEEAMATFEHGVICSNINGELRAYLKGKKLGRLLDSSTEYRFLKDRISGLGSQPDVSFVKQERLPARFDTYPEIAPDLAVEVVSPTDKDLDIEMKIALYQKYGVSQIWIVHPFSRRIDVYCQETGLHPQSYLGADELNLSEIIPGLKVILETIFDYPANLNIDTGSSQL